MSLNINNKQVDDTTSAFDKKNNGRSISVDLATGAETSGKTFASNRVKSTKYTWWSFAPMAILTQLSNVVNCFFIMNGFLQYFPSIKTNSPWASHFPVFWVIIMGIIFELLEELKRNDQDKEENSIKVTQMSLNSGKMEDKDTVSVNLKVGQIIKLKNNMVPADCLVLQTKDAKGLCYISTESLDGERNLKTKIACSATQANIESLCSSKAKLNINYHDPNPEIQNFSGNLSCNDQTNELGIRNFIPRGTFVKNSEDVIVMVVYTGTETKLSQNLGKYQYKIGALQKILNNFIAVNVVMWIVWIIFMSQIMHRVWTSSKVDQKHFYIFGDKGENDSYSYIEDGSANSASLKAIASFYLLLNGIIPLNLAVINVLARFIYLPRIQNDPEMINQEKSERTGKMQGCKVKNLALLQDLALVNNLFCDKTGTLTQNELVFKSLCFDGKVFSKNDSW
jgi:phospholipid-transporting ATPase